MCMTFPRGLGPAFLTLSGLELKYSRMNWMDAGGYYIPSLFPYQDTTFARMMTNPTAGQTSELYVYERESHTVLPCMHARSF